MDNDTKWSIICDWYQYIQDFKEKKEGSKHNCYILNEGLSGRGYAYKEKQVNGERYRIGIHQIVAFHNNHILALPENLETSHLCGEKLCVLDEHIVLESKPINMQRKDCHRKGNKCPLSKRCRKVGHIPKCFM